MDQANQRINALSNEINSIKDDHLLYQQESISLHDKNEELTKDLESAEAIINQLEADKQSKLSELETSASQISKLKNEVANLKKEVELANEKTACANTK